MRSSSDHNYTHWGRCGGEGEGEGRGGREGRRGADGGGGVGMEGGGKLKECPVSTRVEELGLSVLDDVLVAHSEDFPGEGERVAAEFKLTES